MLGRYVNMLCHHISVPIAYRRQRTDGPFRPKLANMQEGAFFSTSEPDPRCFFIRKDEYFWTSIVANVSINHRVAHNWQGKAPTSLRTPRTTNRYLGIPVDGDK